MKNRIKIILSIVFLCFTIQSQAQDKKAIVQEISISNFMADHISDSELIVTVDYSFNGKTGSKDIYIHAFPEMEDGSYNFRDVDIAKVPLKPGNNQVSLKIIKRPQTKNFSSKSIKICMIAFRSEILCQKFPFTKSWKSTIKIPKIISFTAKKTNIKKGNSTTLAWQTENAYNISLEGGHPFTQKVKPSGFINVSPEKTTTYRLNATGSMQTDKRYIRKPGTSMDITIIVDSVLPEIVDFRVEPQNIKRGKQVRFYWQVKNAQKVQLFDSYGEIESRIQLPNGAYGWLLNIDGSYMENLNKSETYILKASNNIGSVEKQVKVSVGKKID